jgi:hypothetical protein
MNQPKREEFLMQSVENLRLLNYYFQVNSDWARGKEEMLMLSIMINKKISPEIEGTISALCKNFSEKMQSNEDIFTGFHIKELDNFDEIDKLRIKKNNSIIRDWVQDLYWEILEDTRKVSEEEILTSVLDERYIFESLEEMSKEVKKISKEINLSKNSLKRNSNIKDSILKLNKIIDDLYEGYIERMTVLDIESENGFLSPNEDLDIEKRKKELLSVLEGEVSGTEIGEDEE